MLPTVDVKPVVLLLGEVISARAEWNALRAIAELRVWGFTSIQKSPEC